MPDEFQQIFQEFIHQPIEQAVAKLTTFLENHNVESLNFNQFFPSKELTLTPLWYLIMLWEKGYFRPLEIVLVKVSDEKLNTFNFDVAPNKFSMNAMQYFAYTLYCAEKKQPDVFLTIPSRLTREKLCLLDLKSTVQNFILIAIQANSVPFLTHFLQKLPAEYFNDLVIFEEGSLSLLFIYAIAHHWQLIEVILTKLSLTQLRKEEEVILDKIEKEKEIIAASYIPSSMHRLFLSFKVAQLRQLFQENKEEEYNLELTQLKGFLNQWQHMGAAIFSPVAAFYKEVRNFTDLEKVLDKLDKNSLLYLEACQELAHFMFYKAIEERNEVLMLEAFDIEDENRVLMLKAFDYAVVAREAYSDNLPANIGYYYVYGEKAPPPSQAAVALISEQLIKGSEKACLFSIRAQQRSTSSIEEGTNALSSKKIETVHRP